MQTSEGRTSQSSLDCDRLWGLTFSPDSKTVLSGNKHGNIEVWDVATGVKQLSWHAATHSVKYLGFSADGTVLCSAAPGGSINAWRIVRHDD